MYLLLKYVSHWILGKYGGLLEKSNRYGGLQPACPARRNVSWSSLLSKAIILPLHEPRCLLITQWPSFWQSRLCYPPLFSLSHGLESLITPLDPFEWLSQDQALLQPWALFCFAQSPKSFLSIQYWDLNKTQIKQKQNKTLPPFFSLSAGSMTSNMPFMGLPLSFSSLEPSCWPKAFTPLALSGRSLATTRPPSLAGASALR